MARNSNFGKNLRALREDRKMTQARLAAALDITTATVSHWENRGDKSEQQGSDQAALQRV